MQLGEVGILAVNGAGLVEGDFRLASDDPEARNLVRPDGARIAVRLGTGRVGSGLSLVGDVRRDPDGFYSAGPPVLELTLEPRAMTSLEDMLVNLPMPARAEFHRPGGRLATVQARHPAAGDELFSRITGAVDSLTVEAVPEDTGLRLKLEGEVGPMTTYKVEGPILTRARLTANVVVPWAYLKVQNSGLAWIEAQMRQSFEGGQGPFRFGPTLAGLALNQFSGSPYFQGGLGFPRDGGPCVEAHLAEHLITLRPAAAPSLTTTGFVQGKGAGGPQMTLFGLGYADWSRMLEYADIASLEQRGGGIGYVDQFTGPSVGAAGGSMRQAVEACRVELMRRPEGVAIAIDGELGDVQRETVFEGRQVTSLGRSFTTQLLVPTAYILARNLPVPRYREERQQALQGAA